jgi:hypothetical protein
MYKTYSTSVYFVGRCITHTYSFNARIVDHADLEYNFSAC